MPVEMLFYLCMLLIFVTKKLKYIEKIGALLLTPSLLSGLDWLKTVHQHTYQLIRVYYALISHWPLFFAGIVFY